MQIFGVSHKTIHNWIELNAYETWESLVSYVEKFFETLVQIMQLILLSYLQ